MKDYIKKSWIFFIKLFWIFILGSFFGYIVETIYAYIISGGHLVVRQGLVYGPFIQVYGLGAMIYYILLLKTQDTKKVFIYSFFMGGALEYICSFMQEIFLKSISWDYSGSFLNLNGRTNFVYCIFWGLIGIAFLKIFWRFVPNLDKVVSSKKWRFITYILMIFIFFDITISCMACTRQNERHKNIPPKNSLDSFLDTKYPDDFMNKIYNNKILIINENDT